MYLNDILKEYVVEDTNHECKARLNHEDTLGWIKTIDGFANTQGGTLYLGVENKTNKLIGYNDDELDKEKLFLYNEIKEHFKTQPVIHTTLIPYLINDKKRYILAVEVEESKIKPVIISYQGMPMIFKRRDGYTSPVTVEEIIALSINEKQVTYDEQSTDISYDRNKFTMLQSFYKEHTGKELTDKELASIGFFDNSGKLKQGSLLFMDDYDGKDSTVVCSLYKGFTRGDNEVIASNTKKGNLLECFSFLWEFVQQRMNHGFIKTETSRIDVDAYPSRALLEAIINALAHRDYFISGTAIYLDLFKNRLVISSPGNCYGKDDIPKTYHLESFISKRRNELISNVFVLCHAMEAKGTGFEKIVEDYKNQDESHQPFVYSKNNQFSIILPDITYSDGVITDEESIKILSPIENPARHDSSILAFCYQNYRSVKEIVDYLHVTNSTFFRKKIIDRLVEQGFLLENTVGNTKVYRTNVEKVSRI